MTEQFLLHINDYLNGAALNLQYWGEIKSLLEKYEDTLKLWDRETTIEQAEKQTGASRYTVVCRTMNGIKKNMKADRRRFEDFFITQQSGIGVDPCRIIQLGLKQYPNIKEKKALQQTLAMNILREEILLFDTNIIEPLVEKSILVSFAENRVHFDSHSSKRGRPKGKVKR